MSSPSPSPGFPVFSLASMRIIADQIGLQDIGDDVLLLVSEDLAYHLREMIYNSVQLAKHCGRNQLSASDVDRALSLAAFENLASHDVNQLNCPEYESISDVFIVKDREVDLITESEELLAQRDIVSSTERDEEFPCMHWLTLNGRILTVPSEETSTTSQPNLKVSQTLLNYYDCIVKAVLSPDTKENIAARKDLATNRRIQPVVCNIVTTLINKLKSPETDFKTVLTIISTFNRILENEFLFLGPCFRNLIDSITDLILNLQPKLTGTEQVVRWRAASFLSSLMSYIDEHSHIFALNPESVVLERLHESLNSPPEEKSFFFGILLICINCGVGESAFDFLKITTRLHETFLNNKTNLNQDQELHSLFAMTAGVLMARLSPNFLHLNPLETSALLVFYTHYCETYSDSLTCFLVPVHTNEPHEWENTTPSTLGWIQPISGQELLDSFYSATQSLDTETCAQEEPMEQDQPVAGTTITSLESDCKRFEQQLDVREAFEDYCSLAAGRKVIKIVVSSSAPTGKCEASIASGQKSNHDDKEPEAIAVSDADDADAKWKVLRTRSVTRGGKKLIFSSIRKRSYLSCRLIDCFL